MEKIAKSYHCDVCGKDLPTYDTCPEVLIQVKDAPMWVNILVAIRRKSGWGNTSANEGQADLCSGCLTQVLQEVQVALKTGRTQVKLGDSAKESEKVDLAAQVGKEEQC